MVKAERSERRDFWRRSCQERENQQHCLLHFLVLISFDYQFRKEEMSNG